MSELNIKHQSDSLKVPLAFMVNTIPPLVFILNYLIFIFQYTVDFNDSNCLVFFEGILTNLAYLRPKHFK